MEQVTTFDELQMDEELMDAVKDLGYEQPTPIQAKSIPPLMKGYDLIGQSPTGSGKTTAYAIPMIELTDPDDKRLQGLVLCPTRELCLQIADEIRKLLKYKSGIRVVAIYGGQPIQYQIKDMRRGMQIAVATPGRLIDHLQRHTLKLSQVQIAVVDEADEMFDMGFKDDLHLILSQLPEERQTVLYSATITQDVKELSEKYMQDPVEILSAKGEELTVDPVKQVYFEVREGNKTEALLRLLELEKPSRALIFLNTKKRVQDLSELLRKKGLEADALHGDLKQVQRDLVMRRFREGKIPLLLATDVAARGLDIPDIDIVFNYDMPDEAETYVHRIGRTARAGRSGKAYSLVTPSQMDKLKDIMDYAHCTIEPSRLPTFQEIEEAGKQAVLKKVREALKEEAAGNLSFAKYAKDVEKLTGEGYEPVKVAQALLRELLYRETPREDALSQAPTRIVRHPEDTVRLHLNLGRKQRVRVKDITAAFSSTCGIAPSDLGRIDLMETFSFVEVPAELYEAILKDMNGTSLKGYKVRLEIAAPERKNDK